MSATRNKRSVTDFDKKLGSAITSFRVALGLSQNQLAQAIHMTYQQVHKYEIGQNRVSASTLQNIALALNKPVQDFYDATQINKKRKQGPGNRRQLIGHANFERLDPNLQDAVLQFVHTLANPK